MLSQFRKERKGKEDFHLSQSSVSVAKEKAEVP